MDREPAGQAPATATALQVFLQLPVQELVQGQGHLGAGSEL